MNYKFLLYHLNNLLNIFIDLINHFIIFEILIFSPYGSDITGHIIDVL